MSLLINSIDNKETSISSVEGWIDEEVIKEAIEESKNIVQAKKLLELESVNLDKEKKKLKESKHLKNIYLIIFTITIASLIVFFVIIPFLNSKSEKKLWNNVMLENSVISYDDYLEKFPGGKFYNEALRRKHIAELEADELKWREALLINTKKGYREYLSINKIKSNHDNEAKVLLDELNWREAIEKNTVESLKDYLSVINLYEGKYQEEAYKRLKDLEIKREVSIKEIEIEKKLWNKTLASNSIDAYYNYLKQYSNGRYKNQAKLNIKYLKDENK